MRWQRPVWSPGALTIMKFFVTAVRVILAVMLFPVTVALVSGAVAQDDPAKPATTPPPAAEKPVDPNKPAAAAFDKLFTEWKTLIKDLRQVKVRYQTAPEADQAKLTDEWNALMVKGNAMLVQLQDAGVKAYAEAPNEDPQLTRFLVKLVSDAADRDEYEMVLAVATVLIDNKCEDRTIYGPASLAAYATHDFDKAIEWNNLAKEAGNPSEMLNRPDLDLAAYKKLWEDEQAIRAKEAEKNDLPRVKLTTTKGDIVVELFEDQAPNTVANFVSLVESGFYNDKNFHRVLKNFMAQGGCPKGDGTGGPGYEIACECYEPNKPRMHFRGTLSMAHAGRDTGGSQFFLTFLPTSHLNGRHTAFGRVIEGMDVLARLQRIDPMGDASKAPDKIVTAEVVRKRDHEYKPKKVGE
jgi:cyclophilin family peptidyl-prolyl cis-trans isomerase